MSSRIMFKCLLCEKWVSSSPMVVQERSHFGIKEHKCDGCTKEFHLKTRKQMNNLSNLSVTDESDFEDDTSVVDFPYGLETYHRSGSHKLMASYVNFKRTRNYLRLCGLRKHLRLKPDQKRHNCEVCKKVFKNEKLMSFHECKLIRKYLNKHTDDKRFMKYNSDSKIKHFENKEPNKFRKEAVASQCKTCDRLFADDDAYNKHLKIKHIDRSVKKRLACDRCNYSTDHKGNFQRHMVSHTKERAYQCTVCTKSYTQISSLTRHMKCVHTKESKHECKICLKVFTLRSNLLRHVKSVHDKIKSYVCTECRKSFGQSGSLNQHIRIHTNVKPFKCLFCGKAFSHSSNLSRHIITTHTRTYPHHCTICKKGFTAPSELRKHRERNH